MKYGTIVVFIIYTFIYIYIYIRDVITVILLSNYCLQTGDRFYYENGDDSNTRFTLKQLNQLRKTTLARIICDNGHHIERIQPKVFKKSNSKG